MAIALYETMSIPEVQVSPETLPVSDDWTVWPAAAGASGANPLRQSRFQVMVRQSVLNDITRHGKSAPDVEICGVLLGNVYRDEHGPLLYIEAIIRGDHAKGHAAQVTFTSETWSYIHEQLEKNHPDKRIAGWYHTHPGHGIFLSGMDLFIQQNFFNLPWQVAYVYDPQGGDDGMFVWRDGQTVRDQYLLEHDEVRLFNPAAVPQREFRTQRWPREPGWWFAPLITLVVSFILGFIAMAWWNGQIQLPWHIGPVWAAPQK